MANITGTGALVVEELEIDHGLSIRSKEITGTGNLLVEEVHQGVGTGLKYVDGEILGHLTDLVCEEVVMSGTGKVDNLAGIPRATCDPIKARFHTCNTVIQARFKVT